MALLGGQVHENDEHRLVAEAPGGHEPLVTTDYYVVIVPGDDGVKEAELAQGAGKGIELCVADLAGVSGVRV